MGKIENTFDIPTGAPTPTTLAASIGETVAETVARQIAAGDIVWTTYKQQFPHASDNIEGIVKAAAELGAKVAIEYVQARLADAGLL